MSAARQEYRESRAAIKAGRSAPAAGNTKSGSGFGLLTLLGWIAVLVLALAPPLFLERYFNSENDSLFGVVAVISLVVAIVLHALRNKRKSSLQFVRFLFLMACFMAFIYLMTHSTA